MGMSPGRLSRVAVLWNPAVPDKVVEWKEMEAPARKLGLQLQSAEVRGPEEFERAFAQGPGHDHARGAPYVHTPVTTGITPLRRYYMASLPSVVGE